MKSASLRYILFLYCVLSVCINSLGASKIDDVLIIPEVDNSSYYSNQVGKLTLWLYTLNPEISGVNEISPVRIEGGEFSYICRIKSSQPFRMVKRNGKDYYASPLAEYAFMIKDSGKYKISGGEFQIGVNIPVVVHDPFWGAVKSYKTEIVSVKAGVTSVKIKSLPSNDKAKLFSGAVGNYKVEVSVPGKNIIVNEPTTIRIIIEGIGLIGDDTLPDYHNAFTGNVKLKSMNENNDYFYDGNNVMSRKILKCEVIPTSRDDCRIGPVEFGFFNPDTGKYEVSVSEPIDLDVKSSTVKITPFDV